MTVPPSGLFGVDTLAERLVATTLVLGGLVAVGLVAHRVVTTARRGRYARVVDVLVASVVLASVAAAGALLVGVWQVGPFLTAFAARLDVENPVGTAALAVATLALVAAAYVGSGLTSRLVHEVADLRTGVTEHQAEVVYRVLQLGIYALVSLVVLGLWEVNLGGLLVGAGFLGIVLGMAARQTLGSLLAGFVLMFARPFEIGDWVQIGDKEGIVTDITIVNTRIQTFDGEFVMLPNDTVSASEVVNRTRKGRLRIHVDVGVDYGADLDRAVELAREAMGDVDQILTVPRPQVVCKEFDRSAVVLGLRFWIDKPSARRKWRAQTAVIRAVKTTFDEAGVKIPFPQREVSGRDGTGGFRASTPPAAAVRAAGRDGEADGGRSSTAPAGRDEAGADETAGEASAEEPPGDGDD